jgi:hypothetical protein
MTEIYTTPKLSKTGISWFVHFRFEGKQFRYKYGLNRIEDLIERERKFLILCEVLEKDLKAGWNPNIPEIIPTQSELTLVEALEFSLDKKKPNISPKTYSGYNGSVNFITTAINKIGLDKLKITETKRVHVKLIIEKAK